MVLYIRYLLLSICFFLTACTTPGRMINYAPPPEPLVLASINIMDRNGFSETISNPDRLKQYENVDFLSSQPYQKVLRIYARDGCGNIQAYITSYHPNGQVRQYLEVSNNRANGAYREWHSNGFLKLDTFVIGGEADINESAERTWLFDGRSRAWDEDGHLIADISYSNGELDGPSDYFHPGGSLWKRMQYCRDKLEGPSEIFLTDGTLLQSTHYVQGNKHGHAVRYWKPDLISAEEEYCNGRLVTGNYYDLTGPLVSTVKEGEGFRVVFGKSSVSELQEYHNGVQDGVVKAYDECANLIRTTHFKNQIKHGEEIYYYVPERPKLSIEWVEGKIQGSVKTWYPNGIQESQREMSENKKNGVLMGWYVDGSVMLIEEYDHNKLVRGEYFKQGEAEPISVVRTGQGTATLFDAQGNFLRKVEYNNGKPFVD